jgi:hypothetical protein
LKDYFFAASDERDRTQVPQIQRKAEELRDRASRLQKWRIQTQDFDEKLATQVIRLGDDGVTQPTLQKSVKAGVDKNVWEHLSQNKKNPQHALPKKFNDQEEFTHLRYTPVCSPKPILYKNDYSLRCSHNGRKVRHLITVTMYNEAWTEVRDTLTGICNGLQHMVENTPGVDAADIWQVSGL